MDKHLWEFDHPYYMKQGNYYTNDAHADFKTLDEFLDEWGDADIEYNRVHRWDWLEGDDWDVPSDGSDDVMGQLRVYFIMQRKARLFSCHIDVRRSDEARVIEFLTPHFEQEMEIWQPFKGKTE